MKEKEKKEKEEEEEKKKKLFFFGLFSSAFFFLAVFSIMFTHQYNFSLLNQEWLIWKNNKKKIYGYSDENKIHLFSVSVEKQNEFNNKFDEIVQKISNGRMLFFMTLFVE